MRYHATRWAALSPPAPRAIVPAMVRSVAVLCVCVLALALAGCGGGGKDPWEPSSDRPAVAGPEDTGATAPGAHAPVRVALLLPLSGDHAAMGAALSRAAQMALFDAGDDALTLALYDTAGDADTAARVAHQAVTQGADIVLGPLFAPAVEAAAGPARRARVPLVALSTDWALAGRGTFVMGFMPFDQVERVAQAAAARGARRVGVILPAGRYGDAVGRAWDGAAARHGITTVARTALPAAGGAELVRAVQNFTAAAPPMDAVFMPVGGTAGRTVANLLTAGGLPPSAARRLGTGLWDDPAMAYERALDGGLFAAPDPAARARFESRYAALYGARPPRLATLGYDAMALAAVLGRAGPGAYTTAALSSPNGFAGLDGIFRFAPGGLAERGLAVLRLEAGRAVVAEPAPPSFAAPALAAR